MRKLGWTKDSLSPVNMTSSAISWSPLWIKRTGKSGRQKFAGQSKVSEGSRFVSYRLSSWRESASSRYIDLEVKRSRNRSTYL